LSIAPDTAGAAVVAEQVVASQCPWVFVPTEYDVVDDGAQPHGGTKSAEDVVNRVRGG
jgi:hypothetical protein